jgi:hypothetical protein
MADEDNEMSARLIFVERFEWNGFAMFVFYREVAGGFQSLCRWEHVVVTRSLVPIGLCNGRWPCFSFSVYHVC